MKSWKLLGNRNAAVYLEKRVKFRVQKESGGHTALPRIHQRQSQRVLSSLGSYTIILGLFCLTEASP
jgi:hypothetical protein